MLFMDFLFLFVAFVFFAISAQLVVKSIIKINSYYRLREFVVGLLLIGVSTSLPEFSIGIFSSLGHISSLSFGNILGANIVDLTLVIGLVAILGKRVNFEVEIEKRTIYLISSMVFLPLLLFMDQELSRFDGAVLIAAFVIYVINLIIKRKKFKVAKKEKCNKKELHRNMIIFFVSLLALVLTARTIVEIAADIAIELVMPPILIGMVIVSIGTTLPEIFFETNSVLKGHSSLAIGDLLGSLVVNSTLILGAVAMIEPIKAHFFSFILSTFFLVIALISFIVASKTGRRITRREGILLLMLYVLFILSSIVTS